MGYPRALLGAALLMLSVHASAALDMAVDARISDTCPVVDCRVTDLDTVDLIRRLNRGETARVTWYFRLGDSDATVVRFVHRDILAGGYLVYADADDAGSGPFAASELPEELFVLEGRAIPELGTWEPDEVLEGRLYLTAGTEIPPFSLIGGRQRSRRCRTAYPEADSR